MLYSNEKNGFLVNLLLEILANTKKNLYALICVYTVHKTVLYTCMCLYSSQVSIVHLYVSIQFTSQYCTPICVYTVHKSVLYTYMCLYSSQVSIVHPMLVSYIALEKRDIQISLFSKAMYDASLEG